MAVIALRRPNAWAFGAFTKVTPAMGLLWPLVRGQVREVIRIATLMAVLAALSFAISPAWWSGWVAVLQRSLSVADPWVLPVPLVVRLPAAIGLLIWAARTDRAWLLPVAILLGLPAIRVGSLALLLAVPPLLGGGARPDPGHGEVQAASRLGSTPRRASSSRHRWRKTVTSNRSACARSADGSTVRRSTC